MIVGQVWTVLEQFTIWVGLVTIALGLAKLVFVPSRCGSRPDTTGAGDGGPYRPARRRRSR